MASKKRLSIEELKTCSEIFSNFFSPLTVIAAAIIAVAGASKVVEVALSGNAVASSTASGALSIGPARPDESSVTSSKQEGP